MFSLENLFDEKDMYPYLHCEMFGQHLSDMSDIYPSWVSTYEFDIITAGVVHITVLW